MRKAFKSVLVLSAATGSLARAASGQVTYQVNADTTAIAGQSGYLDIEFNPIWPNNQGPGTLTHYSPDAQAVVSNFQSDATWNTDYANYPSWDNPPQLGNTTGTPQTGMTMIQDTLTNPGDDPVGTGFDLIGTFGTSISFDVTISGDVFNAVAPAANGNIIDGADTFYFDFYDMNGNLLESSGSSDVNFVNVTAGGAVNTEDGSNGGDPGVVITQVVPEPASLSVVGVGAMGLLGRRRRAGR
jgi:hypothetical protein